MIKINLITLCKLCHNKIHNTDKKIEGYVKTSKGTKIKITDNNNNIEFQ